MPAVTVENIGRLRASDLLGASELFDAKYHGSDG